MALPPMQLPRLESPHDEALRDAFEFSFAYPERVRRAGPQVPDHILTLRRYLIADTLDNARDVTERDPVAAFVLSASALREAMVLAYIMGGRWAPRDKDLFEGLGEAKPEAAPAVEAYARSPSVESAALAVQAHRRVRVFRVGLPAGTDLRYRDLRVVTLLETNRRFPHR